MIRKRLFILILRALSEDAQQYAMAVCCNIAAWDELTMDFWRINDESPSSDSSARKSHLNICTWAFITSSSQSPVRYDNYSIITELQDERIS